MIDGIVFGDDPKQGFVENWNFYHPELKFQFPVPRDWQYENSPIQFRMAAKDGKSMMMLTVAEGKTLDEAAQNAVKNYNFKVLENKKTTTNGIPTLVMVSQIQQQQQQGGQTAPQQAQDPNTVVQVVTYLYQYNGMILAMHGMSYAPTFAANLPTFRNVGENFRNLNDPDKLNRKPDRIRIKTVARTAASFKDVMKSFGMPDSKLEELGILNQLQANDQVQQGTLVKIITK
jgi:predicted Zn-dependent protease